MRRDTIRSHNAKHGAYACAVRSNSCLGANNSGDCNSETLIVDVGYSCQVLVQSGGEQWLKVYPSTV